MNRKMVAVLLHLGTNMWQKPGISPNYLEIYGACENGGYTEKLITDRAVWREVTDFLPTVGINTLLIDMGEGVELKRHPELAIEGTWSQEEFKAELRRLRSLGLTPLPKFNFSWGHNAWMKEMAYHIDTPDYYAFCKDIIEETCELFDHPALFHLGLEEEDPASQMFMPVIITRSRERKAYDANFLFDVCRACGARPWIWIDPLSIKDWGGKEGFCAAVPKDVLVSNWYYGHRIYVGTDRVFESPRVSLYRDLEEWGYDQVPTVSTYSYYLNSRLTARLIKDYLDPAHIAGIMSASWLYNTPGMKEGLLYDAEILGDAVKAYPLK